MSLTWVSLTILIGEIITVRRRNKDRAGFTSYPEGVFSVISEEHPHDSAGETL